MAFLDSLNTSRFAAMQSGMNTKAVFASGCTCQFFVPDQGARHEASTNSHTSINVNAVLRLVRVLANSFSCGL